MSFICVTIKGHFHINGFELSLALKQMLKAIWKWTIVQNCLMSALHDGYCTFPVYPISIRMLWENCFGFLDQQLPLVYSGARQLVSHTNL